MRYMGTKRNMAPLVTDQIQAHLPPGHVVDLFGGAGAVCHALAPDRPVVFNDSLFFTTVLARARLLNRPRRRINDVASEIDRMARTHLRVLTRAFRRRLAAEQRALDGGMRALGEHIATAPHVGSSRHYAAHAARSGRASGPAKYDQIVLHHSAAYFSTRQAMELDALRYAIDLHADTDPATLDWTLAAWLETAAALVNGPGHTAQFLRPNTPQAFSRIRRQWQRSPLGEYSRRLADEAQPVGTYRWRRANRVLSEDVNILLSSDALPRVAGVYADPPYRNEQYSRYYHVLETLARYQFDGSVGLGRYPRLDCRIRSDFSQRRTVVDAFRTMFRLCASRGLSMVLSYPATGLLEEVGTSPSELAQDYLHLGGTVSAELKHSTMGASRGSTTTAAIETLYLFYP